MTHGHSEVSHRWRGKQGKTVIAHKILKGIKEQLERENKEILTELASEIKKGGKQPKRS